MENILAENIVVESSHRKTFRLQYALYLGKEVPRLWVVAEEDIVIPRLCAERKVSMYTVV